MVYFLTVPGGLYLAACGPFCVNHSTVCERFPLEPPLRFVRVSRWDTPAIRETLPC